MTRALAFGGLLAALFPLASLAAPTSVTVIGDLQQGAGCAANNDPTCAQTALTYDTDDDKWQGSFNVKAGTWHFKVALDGSLAQTHGGPGGADVVLTQATEGAVKFYFDANTLYVTSSRSGTIATVAGSFQSELSCPGDWQPDCLRSMMEDPGRRRHLHLHHEGAARGQLRVQGRARRELGHCLSGLRRVVRGGEGRPGDDLHL